MNMPTTLRAAVAAFAAGAIPAFGQQVNNPATATEETIELSPFEVTSEQALGYKAANSVTASRFSLPILDTPMSIQVVTEDFMKDIGARDALESLSYVSGITQGESAIRLEGSTNFNIRGVPTGFTLRDGVSSYGFNDAYNVERWEVLKGITGMMYGSRNLGGVINSVTRKPRDTFGGEVLLRTDNNDSWRIQGNFGGPLTEDKSLLYVVSFFKKDEGTFMDYERLRAHGVTGAMSWQPFTNTRIRVEAETYGQDNTLAAKLPPLQLARGARTLGDSTFYQRVGYAPVPLEFNYAGREAYLREQNKNYTVTLDQKISSFLDFRSYLAYSKRKQDRLNRDAAATYVTIAPGRARDYYDYASNTIKTEVDGESELIIDGMNANLREFRNWNTIWRNDLIANYSFAGIKNRTLIGYEYQERSGDFKAYDAYSPVTLDGRVPGLLPFARDKRVNTDLRTFDPNLPMPSRAEIVARAVSDPNDQFGNFNGSTNETKAYYIVHYSQLWNDRLTLFGGVRKDKDRNKENFQRLSSDIPRPNGNPRPSPNGEKVYGSPTDWSDRNSPQVGASFRILKDLSVYATWSDVLVSENSPGTAYIDQLINNNGTWTVGPFVPQDPQTGVNKELGFKFDMLDGRLSGTAAFFDLTLKNKAFTVGTNDLDNITGGQLSYRTLAGEEKYEGFELDLLYNVSQNWSAVFSYAYTDARITKDSGTRSNNPNPVGTPPEQELPNVIEPSLQGQATPNLPKNQFRLWNNYRFRGYEGLLKDASMGLGVRYWGDAPAGFNNFKNLIVKAHYVVDFSASKSVKLFGRDVRVTGRVNNVLDERYYSSRQIYGEPREFILEARTSF